MITVMHFIHHPQSDIERELEKMDSADLRELKLMHSEARRHTPEYTLFVVADRILRSRERIYVGRVGL